MLIPTSCLISIVTSLSLKLSVDEKIRDLIPMGARGESIIHVE
jgi:hypothetical protein